MIQKLLLLASAVQKRMQWARDNTGMDWTWLVWMDEMMMMLGEKLMHRKVTWHPGEEFFYKNVLIQEMSVGVLHSWYGVLLGIIQKDHSFGSI